MRALVIIISLLMLASVCTAQSTMPAPPPPSGVPTMILLDIQDMPLKQALEEIMRHAHVPYTLDPALDSPPYSNIRISLKVRNGSFDELMENLRRTYNLSITVENGTFAVRSLMVPQSKAPNLQSDLVTISIPAMPVKDALAMVCPNCGWAFGDDLGRTPMPGVRFYQFPREMAAAIVLTAAGLIQPMGNSKQITARGRADLSANWQYMPGRAQNQAPASQGGYAVQNYYYANQIANNVQQTPQEGIAIAAYGAGSQMRFTILANQARDTDLLDRLFTLSGQSYVMGDLSVRPVASAGGSQPGQQAFSKPKAVTAQLRNVTLDQALSSLLPPCNLRYRRMGLANNPTYMIETLVPSSSAVEPAASSAAPMPVPH